MLFPLCSQNAESDIPFRTTHATSVGTRETHGESYKDHEERKKNLAHAYQVVNCIFQSGLISSALPPTFFPGTMQSPGFDL